jgi:hypothetical protein
MVRSFERRPESEIGAEQSFLQQRALDIEKAMGRVAGRAAAPTPISQPLDALDRARELTNDMYKQVRVRPLEEAITAQLAWLETAEARLTQSDGEPKVQLSKIALDRRLLQELRDNWQAKGR